MKFKLKDDGVIRLDDNANIPDAPGNRDWQEYQEWLVKGNTPEPADPLPLPMTDKERAETAMTTEPIWRAWIKRMAKAEGKTEAQIRDEVSKELP